MAQVLELAQRLRRDFLDVQLDAFVVGNPAEGWPLWAEREIRQADYILLVCTHHYYRRWCGEADPGRGLGATWEADLIRGLLWGDPMAHARVVPVLFPPATGDDIPEPLRPNTTNYVLMERYTALKHHLLQLPPATPHPLNSVPEDLTGARSQETEPQFSDPIRRRMADLGRRVETLTNEQVRVLDQARTIRRLRISGVAGSGKTLIAAEKAIRLSRAGQITLFLCHNPYLAKKLHELTAGTGVDVFAFGDWVSNLCGQKTSEQSTPWSYYEEPPREHLDAAKDRLTSHGGLYDAVIVDEGQDFRDEWWPLVDASLRSRETACLYIFHDDHQALLPYLKAYPFQEPVLDLSRNCRNAGRVHELMRLFLPQAPPTDLLLLDQGDRYWTTFQDDPTDAVVRCAQWIDPTGKFASCVAIHAGVDSFDESILGRREFLVAADGWREVVVGEMNSALDSGVASGVRVSLARRKHIARLLSGLSGESYPRAADVDLVCEAARQVLVDERLAKRLLRESPEGGGVTFQRASGRLALRGAASHSAEHPLPAEVILHFQRPSWPAGLPKPYKVRFAPHSEGLEDAIPTYSIAEFKGLESDDVLLVIDSSGAPPAREALYVGVSRARFRIAVAISGRLWHQLPEGMRSVLFSGPRARVHETSGLE
jgi:hypothetical protein